MSSFVPQSLEINDSLDWLVQKLNLRCSNIFTFIHGNSWMIEAGMNPEKGQKSRVNEPSSFRSSLSHPPCDRLSTQNLISIANVILYYSPISIYPYVLSYTMATHPIFVKRKKMVSPRNCCFSTSQLPELLFFHHLWKRLTLRPRSEIKDSWLVTHQYWGAVCNHLANNIIYSHKWGHPTLQKNWFWYTLCYPKLSRNSLPGKIRYPKSALHAIEISA